MVAKYPSTLLYFQHMRYIRPHKPLSPSSPGDWGLNSTCATRTYTRPPWRGGGGKGISFSLIWWRACQSQQHRRAIYSPAAAHFALWLLPLQPCVCVWGGDLWLEAALWRRCKSPSGRAPTLHLFGRTLRLQHYLLIGWRATLAFARGANVHTGAQARTFEAQQPSEAFRQKAARSRCPISLISDNKWALLQIRLYKSS